MTDPNLTRRHVLLGAAATAAALSAAGASATVPQDAGAARARSRVATEPVKCRAVDFADVVLLPGPFHDNMMRDLEYMASFDCDRLLAPFQQVAGLATRAPSLGGWESQGLASHYCGHYLSAAAIMHAHTHDRRLAQKVDYLLPRLAACQEANGRGGADFHGYCTGIPQSKPAFRQVLAGDIEIRDPRQAMRDPRTLYSFRLNGLWSPWYTVHKIMAGLRDVWLYMGRVQARDILLGMTDWAAQFPRRLSFAQMQTMLVSEQGGMNEVLADVYAMTGDEAHRTLAEQFNQAAQLAPLMQHQDILDGLHSNQYIPRVIGIARQYELTGSSDYRTGAEFFWQNVVRHRTFVFGGNSDRENFFPIGDAWQHLSVGSAETCCTYNMLKLTSHYFCWNASMEAADFYERAVINHILGSQDPATGGMTYYFSMQPGHFKTFSSPWDSCWCCDGTGMENHAKYSRGVYYHDTDTLWVNLYLASELRWREKGLTIRQHTRFPESNHVRLQIACAQPARATLRLRHPHWSTPAMVVKLNGKPMDAGKPGTWLDLTRDWHDGDVVDIELRTPLRLERMAHHPSKFAILAGPTVLAAALGDALMAPPIPTAGVDQYQFEKVPDPIAIPALAIQGRPVDRWVQPDPAEPLVWHARGVGQPADLKLVPLYRVARERYVVYFDEKIAGGDAVPG